MSLLRVGMLAVLVLVGQSAMADDAKREARDQLWKAVRNADVEAIKKQLEAGGDVNAKNEIGVSALWIAAGKGNREVIELLLKHGADVNVRDFIWYQTPLSSAISDGNAEIMELFLKAGAKDTTPGLLAAIGRNRRGLVKVLLEHGKYEQEVLDAALLMITGSNDELKELLTTAGAKMPGNMAAEKKDELKAFVGGFENDNGGKINFEVIDQGLALKRAGAGLHLLKPLDKNTFQPIGSETGRIIFNLPDKVTVKQYTAETAYFRVGTKTVKEPAKDVQEANETPTATPLNWPAFRGIDASGVADTQQPPITWEVEKGTNVRWKTAIPGLGHSCPVIWGDRVFVTTAISGKAEQTVRIGNYGAVDSVDDTTKHTWQVMCLDRNTGAILWTKTAYEGVPKIKRHLKGSQANCTPATDGRCVVACFGSEGLYCYDFAGKLLWSRDLSSIDSSFQIDKEYEWGFGSSPIIHDGMVILQCDLSKNSFIAAYRLEDGSKAWSTPRDEIPSWSSPTVWRNQKRTEIVTNAAQYARGYDPATGEELWRLAKKSEVTVPTPVIGKDLVFVTSGNRPIQPIFGIRPGATGDISLQKDEEHNQHIAWSKMRGGPYMPTPILYGQYFYTIGNAGMLTCYEAATGVEVYKERVGGSSYTASPVAADGRLYFVAEEGAVRVVKAGPKYELLAVNKIGDNCLATPAICGGALFVRSQNYLWCLGKK